MFVIYGGDRDIQLETETIAQIMGQGKAKITLNGRIKTKDVYETETTRELYIAVGGYPEKLTNTFEEETDHNNWVNRILKKAKRLKHDTYKGFPNKILVEGLNYVGDNIHHSILKTPDLENSVFPDFYQNDELIDYTNKDSLFSLIKLDIPEGKTAFRFHFFTDNFLRGKDYIRYSFYDVPEALGEIRDELKMLELTIEENNQTGLKEINKILKEDFDKLRADYLTHVNHDLIVAPSPRYNIHMIGHADKLNNIFMADFVPVPSKRSMPTFVCHYRNAPGRRGVHFEQSYSSLITRNLRSFIPRKVSLRVAKEEVNKFIEKNKIGNPVDLDIIDLCGETNIHHGILLNAINELGFVET